MITKIGGQSISMGQLELKSDAGETVEPEQLNESEMAGEQQGDVEAGEKTQSANNKGNDSDEGVLKSEQQQNESGQTAESVRKNAGLDAELGGRKDESKRGRRQQSNLGPLVKSVPTKPKLLRRLEASESGSRLSQSNDQRKRYLLLVQLVAPSGEVAVPDQRDGSDAVRAAPNSDK